MDIRLLGPIEASVEGRPAALGPPQQRAVLAMLALEVNRTVPADVLIEGIWGERAPPSAPKVVQLYVSRLRKLLREDEAAIVTRGRGYELRLEASRIDASRFEQLITQAAQAGGAAGRMAREALAMWRGPPLADIGDEPFAAAAIRQLEELRLRAAELAIDADLAAGRHAEVIGELDSLVAQNPLRERLQGQRMLALYRSGRQADALAAYRAARRALVEAIGAEPGPDLRRLHEAILRQEPLLDPLAAGTPGLPAELDTGTALAGRDDELRWLREHWRRAGAGAGALVLIAGASGIGKTRLCAELAASVRRGNGAVLYAAGAAGPNVLLEAAAGARTARAPTLLVLDDADRAGPGAHTALARLPGEITGLPVLAVVTAQDAALGTVLDADETLCLGPLDVDAVRAVAQSHARAEERAEVPVDLVVEASGGVPRRVHDAAAEWARDASVRRFATAADRAASERAGWLAAEDDLTASVVELQTVRERAALRADERETVLCPFKGLAPFDVDDAAVFFGRERLEAELVARLLVAPLLGLIGPSGSGKSSVLCAGLLASLAAGALPGSETWRLVLLRPGEHPVRALDAAIRRAAPHGRLLLAVDQFEEVFTACRDDQERAAFTDALVGCARDPERRSRVLVAVRADYYGACAAHPELARMLAANHVLVGPMRADELRRAIEQPARHARLHVEPALVGALVADVEGEPGALPLLSTALLELWQHRDGRQLRLRAYHETGGVRGSVARLAERAYERLDEQEQELARRVLLRLAGEGEGDAVVRRRVSLAEFDGGRDGPVAGVLSVLAGERLVTLGEADVEVAHEALLREWPRLREWLDEDAAGRRIHRHLAQAAQDWRASGLDPGELYRGARLASAAEWAAANAERLTDVERRFLAAARADADRQAERRRRVTRRLRVLLATVGALLVAAVVAGLLAVDERGNARQQATAAESQRLGARALLENDLDRSLLLARQAVALDDTAQTRGNLLAALLRSPAAIGIVRSQDVIMTAALSPDDGTLAVGTVAGDVLLIDTRTRRRIGVIAATPNHSAIRWLAYSPDGGRLAIGHTTVPGDVVNYPPGWRPVVTVVDVSSGEVVARHLLRRESPFSGGRFSPDGHAIGVTLFRFGYAELTFVRFDAVTGRRQAHVRLAHRGIQSRPPYQIIPRAPVMFTSDGRRIVTSDEAELTVRDATTLRVLRRVPLPTTGILTAYALSGDDRTVAIGAEDGTVRFVDLATGAIRLASGRHDSTVTELRFTADGRTLASTAQSGDVMTWDVRRARSMETLRGHTDVAFSPELAADGATLHTASEDGTVFTWDLAGGRRLGRRFTAGTGDTDRPYLALSSDGRVMAMGQDDGAISVVDADTLTRREPVSVVPAGQVLGIAFVPGGRTMVVGGPEGFLALVDTDRARVIKRLAGHRGAIRTPGISRDGRLMATASDDGVVRLWSLPDGTPLPAGDLRFDQPLSDAQLSPDGRWLTVVLAQDRERPEALEIWDVRERRRRTRVLPPDGVAFTRFSPDGRLMVVGSGGGLASSARVWSTATWKPVTGSFSGHAGPLTAGAISRDGRTLATGSEDGTVRLWDITTEEPVETPLTGEPERPVVPFFTRGGTRLILASDTGRAYLWDLRPQSLVEKACRVAGRRLTPAEWERFLPGRRYAPAC